MARFTESMSTCWRFLRGRPARTPLLGPILVRAILQRRIQKELGRTASITPPRTYNDHVLHRILYDRDPRLRLICDKLTLRDFLRSRVDEAYLVPLIGVWTRVEDVPWNQLPAAFALKPSHGSGWVELVSEEDHPDPVHLRAVAGKWLRSDYFDVSLEWAYKNLPRRLLVEPLLRGPDGGLPREAQAFVFHGKAEIVRIIDGPKGKAERRDAWFDPEGRGLDISVRYGRIAMDAIPAELAEIVRLAERVASGFCHLRVDLYLTDTGLRIGELTPYPRAGRTKWSPPDWDERIGELWSTPGTADRRSVEAAAHATLNAPHTGVKPG